jgi:hypothetical protein
MDKKTIDLKYSIPIKSENGSIIQTKELCLGRLKAKHLKLLPKNFIENDGKIEPSEIIPLIAGLAGISMEAADEIDLEDLMAIAEGMESFLSAFLETGKN